MGRSVLAYQFVSGLLPDLKRKVAGDFDHLLSKARFEEAKRRDLVENTPRMKPQRHLLALFGPPKAPVKEKPAVPTTGEHPSFHCQGTGHFARNCPLRGRAASESRGQNYGTGSKESTKKIATITVNEE